MVRDLGGIINKLSQISVPKFKHEPGLKGQVYFTDSLTPFLSPGDSILFGALRLAFFYVAIIYTVLNCVTVP